MYFFGGPNNNISGEVVTFYVNKQGQSIFLDSSMNEWRYQHAEQDMTFSYNSTNNCALTKPIPQPDSIHFSPYGLWNITLPGGQSNMVMNFQPSRFVLEFDIYFGENQVNNTYPMFGRQPNNLVCVAPFGFNCPYKTLGRN